MKILFDISHKNWVLFIIRQNVIQITKIAFRGNSLLSFYFYNNKINIEVLNVLFKYHQSGLRCSMPCWVQILKRESPKRSRLILFNLIFSRKILFNNVLFKTFKTENIIKFLSKRDSFLIMLWFSKTLIPRSFAEDVIRQGDLIWDTCHTRRRLGYNQESSIMGQQVKSQSVCFNVKLKLTVLAEQCKNVNLLYKELCSSNTKNLWLINQSINVY